MFKKNQQIKTNKSKQKVTTTKTKAKHRPNFASKLCIELILSRDLGESVSSKIMHSVPLID